MCSLPLLLWKISAGKACSPSSSRCPTLEHCRQAKKRSKFSVAWVLHSPSHEINYISHHRLRRRYLAHTLGEEALLPTKRQHKMQKKKLATTDCLHLPFAFGADCTEIILGIISMCICTCCIKCWLISSLHVHLMSIIKLVSLQLCWTSTVNVTKDLWCVL